jgi:hypothetical protein
VPPAAQALLIKHEHRRIAEITRCRHRFAESVRALEQDLVPLAERPAYLAAARVMVARARLTLVQSTQFLKVCHARRRGSHDGASSRQKLTGWCRTRAWWR